MTGGANQLQSGNVAMKMEGPWFLPQMQGSAAKREGGTPFDVVLLPKVGGKTVPHVGLVHGHCMIAASKNQDAAWELLKFVASDKGQQRIATGGRQPATPEWIRKYWMDGVKKNYNFQNAEAFAKALEIGGVSVVGEIDETLLWNEALKEAWDAMQGGMKKASEVIPVANQKIQKILDDYWAKQK
jgi:ABC-type glycerol-3-phosphate transport system substrate-binding protein